MTLDLPVTLPKGWNETRLLPAKPEIQQRALEILGEIPEGKHIAIVAVPNLVGIKLAAMARGEVAGGEWTFTGWVGTRWLDRKPEGGAELRWTR